MYNSSLVLLDGCLSDPCLMNSTCRNTAEGYVCECLKPESSGAHCDLGKVVYYITVVDLCRMSSTHSEIIWVLMCSNVFLSMLML